MAEPYNDNVRSAYQGEFIAFFDIFRELGISKQFKEEFGPKVLREASDEDVEVYEHGVFEMARMICKEDQDGMLKWLQGAQQEMRIGSETKNSMMMVFMSMELSFTIERIMEFLNQFEKLRGDPKGVASSASGEKKDVLEMMLEKEGEGKDDVGTKCRTCLRMLYSNLKHKTPHSNWMHQLHPLILQHLARSFKRPDQTEMQDYTFNLKHIESLLENILVIDKWDQTNQTSLLTNCILQLHDLFQDDLLLVDESFFNLACLAVQVVSGPISKTAPSQSQSILVFLYFSMLCLLYKLGLVPTINLESNSVTNKIILHPAKQLKIREYMLRRFKPKDNARILECTKHQPIETTPSLCGICRERYHKSEDAPYCCSDSYTPAVRFSSFCFNSHSSVMVISNSITFQTYTMAPNIYFGVYEGSYSVWTRGKNIVWIEEPDIIEIQNVNGFRLDKNGQSIMDSDHFSSVSKITFASVLNKLNQEALKIGESATDLLTSFGHMAIFMNKQRFYCFFDTNSNVFEPMCQGDHKLTIFTFANKAFIDENRDRLKILFLMSNYYSNPTTIVLPFIATSNTMKLGDYLDFLMKNYLWSEDDYCSKETLLACLKFSDNADFANDFDRDVLDMDLPLSELLGLVRTGESGHGEGLKNESFGANPKGWRRFDIVCTWDANRLKEQGGDSDKLAPYNEELKKLPMPRDVKHVDYRYVYVHCKLLRLDPVMQLRLRYSISNFIRFAWNEDKVPQLELLAHHYKRLLAAKCSGNSPLSDPGTEAESIPSNLSSNQAASGEIKEDKATKPEKSTPEAENISFKQLKEHLEMQANTSVEKQLELMLDALKTAPDETHDGEHFLKWNRQLNSYFPSLIFLDCSHFHFLFDVFEELQFSPTAAAHESDLFHTFLEQYMSERSDLFINCTFTPIGIIMHSKDSDKYEGYMIRKSTKQKLLEEDQVGSSSEDSQKTKELQQKLVKRYLEQEQSKLDLWNFYLSKGANSYHTSAEKLKESQHSNGMQTEATTSSESEREEKHQKNETIEYLEGNQRTESGEEHVFYLKSDFLKKMSSRGSFYPQWIIYQQLPVL